MDLVEIKILETVIAIVLFFLLRLGISKLISRTVTKSLLQKTRGKIIKKIFLIVLIFITFIFIFSVWGIKQSELYLFLASVLTVIGIALFAQWSHLSNITAGIIIFFNPSVKLDDTVAIIDKDYEVEGRISDIGLFFIKLKTKEGEEINLPNNIFLQKMIKKRNV
ncbi:mechanosensitive ion channel family protein [Flavobacteriaceae bacterium]|jgi:small-conductance mechanosensitive channel|nr:mechanosensitive ion channel family protein [Flavobacteriaceae bacterium]MDA8993333.1 mechanosensitive ion channel family protein [Flavobacteriaceae bacterium]MDB4306799.1 mechanosensitive ion channel family protein [Flavobacteriaceae bacterium]